MVAAGAETDFLAAGVSVIGWAVFLPFVVGAGPAAPAGGHFAEPNRQPLAVGAQPGSPRCCRRQKKERFTESFRVRVGLDRDRPGQVAPLRVELIERRHQVGVGDDRRLAQIAQLVEDAERVDPAPQDVRAGRQCHPVGLQLAARLSATRFRRGAVEAGAAGDCSIFRVFRRGARGFVFASGSSEPGFLRPFDLGSGFGRSTGAAAGKLGVGPACAGAGAGGAPGGAVPTSP